MLEKQKIPPSLFLFGLKTIINYNDRAIYKRENLEEEEGTLFRFDWGLFSAGVWCR